MRLLPIEDIRAMHASSSDAFRVFFSQALSNATSEMHAEDGAEHVKLISTIARELDCDPSKLMIKPPKIKKGLSYWEKRGAENEFHVWYSMVSLLTSPHLNGKDWMVIFTGLAKSVDGMEREHGMTLVERALCRVDITLEAIEAFPKVFRSARDQIGGTALSFIGKGSTKNQLQKLEKEAGVHGLAVQRGVDIVKALQSTKIKEKSASFLLDAATADLWVQTNSPEKTVFEIFARTHGIDEIRAAVDPDGNPALRAAVKTTTHSAQLVGWLLDLGFDAGAKDARGNTALVSCLLSQKESLDILQAFASRSALSEGDIAQLSANPRAIKDPQSRAYIAAREVALLIDGLAPQKQKLLAA